MPQLTLVFVALGLTALVVGLIGLGYYLGWFRFTKFVTVEHKVHRTLTTAEIKRLENRKRVRNRTTRATYTRRRARLRCRPPRAWIRLRSE